MIVIKIGGSAVENIAEIANDLAALGLRDAVIVHGGAAKTTEIAEKMGKPQRFIESVSGFRSRFTDRESMEIFAMVTCGLINKKIVAVLQGAGMNAIGLSGADARLLLAKRKDTLHIAENGKEKILRGDYSGKVEKVNAELLRALLAQKLTPVLAPVALSYENELVSTDADRCAAAIAGALKAEKLLLLTDVDGFFRNFPNDFVDAIGSAGELEKATASAAGGMKKKLLAAREALEQGVQEVLVANGRTEKPISNALSGQIKTRITT